MPRSLPPPTNHRHTPHQQPQQPKAPFMSVRTGEKPEGFRVYLRPRVLGMLFLGFSAGLPLLLVGGTFTAWLRDLGVELAAIGFLSWVGMAHSIKVLWAPVVDQTPIPLLTRILGRRRAWIIAAQ